MSEKRRMSLSRRQIGVAMLIGIVIFCAWGVQEQFWARERGCIAVGGTWDRSLGNFLLHGDENCTWEGS